MPFEAFETRLKNLGLSDKESAVYLALLTLGPSSVLRVSRKAGVARSTTYLMLESLIKKGLATVYEQESRQLFVAEEPEHFRELVDRQKRQLTRSENELNDIIPKLRAFMWSEDPRPTVRYYHGRDGLLNMRYDLVRTSRRGETWHNFMPMDHLYDTFGETDFMLDRQRLARGIKSKTIFTTKSKQLKETVLNVPDPRRIERRFVSQNKFSGGTGFTILNDRVAIGIMEQHTGGFIIESSSVATAMRELFDLAWEKLSD